MRLLENLYTAAGDRWLILNTLFLKTGTRDYIPELAKEIAGSTDLASYSPEMAVTYAQR